jgi:hypothetical protein
MWYTINGGADDKKNERFKERDAEAIRRLIGKLGFKNKSKKREQDFTRERKMGFQKLMYFMLSMIRESSQNAIERFFIKTGENIHMTQQAFSKARQKIRWQAFRMLFDYGVNVHYVNYADEIQRWNGYRIFAIDGSKLSLPNAPPLRKYFGTSGAGSISPTAQGSILYDVLNKMVVDARIEPMKIDERTVAEKHIRHLQKLESFEEWKELILFDRGYPSFKLIEELLEQKIHFLMRVRVKFSTAIDALCYGDHLVELEQDGQLIPLRVIKFRLSSGEVETLITDIMDKKISVKTFKKLYFMRWPVETKYNEIKNRLEIENFSGRLVDNIRQDFFGTMLLTNLAADFFVEAQEGVEKDQKGKGNKYQYKVNMNHEIGVLKDRLILCLLEDDAQIRQEKFQEIVDLLKKRLIPIRPNRSLPRKTPRKAKFHHNYKSNC